MSLKIKLFFLLFSISIFAFAQTNVSGVINSNTTWSLANSPYTVTGNVLVNSGVTLTIEAGVIIKANTGFGIQSSGEIIAIGTSGSRILFTSSAANPAKGDWFGISLLNQSVDPIFNSMGNYVSGTIFKNVDIEYTGHQAWSGGITATDADLYVDHCNLSNGDQYGIFFSSSANDLTIRNCSFLNHTLTGVFVNAPDGFVEMSNSRIENNPEHGIYLGTKNFAITNNFFRNNSTGFVGSAITVTPGSYSSNHTKIIRKNKFIDHGRSTILVEISALVHISQNIFINTERAVVTDNSDIRLDSNVFINNSIIVRDHGGQDLSMKHNHILNNNKSNSPWSGTSVGLVISAYQGFNEIDFGFNTMVNNHFSSDRLLMVQYRNTTSVKVNNNNLLARNSQYFIYNDLTIPQPNIDAKNNYWGTLVTTEIDNKIFDWSDNINKSVVNYSPILIKPDTTAPISPPESVIKKLVSGSVKLSWLANPEEDLAGYKIYWKNPTGYSYDSVVDVGNVTTYTLNGVGNITAEYSVVAYDNMANGNDMDVFEGHQSWFSGSEKYSPTINTSNFNGNIISCYGNTDGQITLTMTDGTAPYTYDWSHDPTLTANQASNLGEGVYHFSITDIGGLIFSDSIVITQPDSLQIQSITVNSNNCSNGSDGSLVFDVIGGTVPYSFSYYNSLGALISTSTSDSISNLPPDTYSVSVSDANSCTVSSQNIILGFTNLSVQPFITALDSAICSGTTTTLSLNNGIQSAVWNDGQTGLTRVLPLGSYWVNSIDTNGCLGASDTIIIKELVALDSSATICLVTFDLTLNKNRIIFDKPDNETGIAAYNIYKDVFGVWQVIGSVNNGDSSQFIDNTSQPSTKVARYYIETEDQCGVTYSTANSTIHKTVLLQSSIGVNNEVNLSWNQYEGASIWYYRILRNSVSSAGFVPIDSVGGTIGAFTDNNPPLGSNSYIIEAVLTSPCTVKAKNNTYSSLTSNSVENTIGLMENLKVDFKIYPNPTNDFLHIECLAGMGSKEISLFDTKGKIIERLKSENKKVRLDLSDLPKGIYHLTITTSQGVLSQLVIRK